MCDALVGIHSIHQKELMQHFHHFHLFELNDKKNMEGSVDNNGLDDMVSYESDHFQERESRCTRYFL